MATKNRSRRWILIGLGAGLVGLLAAVLARKQPLPVEAAGATRGPLRVTIRGEGRTRVRERYTVAAPVSGDLARITLRPGDRVAADAVVARIMPVAPPLLDVRSRAEATARAHTAEAALARTQAQLAGAQVAAELGRKELDRHQQLAQRGAGTAAQLDVARGERERREREVDSLRMALRADHFQLESARAALLGAGRRAAGGHAVPVHAPVVATVLRVLRDSEGPVTAGAPLLEVGDLGTLELVVDLVSSDAVQVAAGMEAAVEHWGGAGALPARVRRVEPSAFTKVSALGVEEQRVNVVLDFDRPPPSTPAAAPIGDGYQADVSIVLWHHPDVLQIPMGALFRERDAWAVYRIEGGVAHRRPLDIGKHDGVKAEVVAGLAAGDRVVVHPGDKLVDGSPVRDGP